MSKKKIRPTWGADPEIMLFDWHLDKIVSAIPVIKRDKHNPLNLGDGIKFYYDNVLAETSFPPSKTKDGLVGWLQRAFARIQDTIGERYRILTKASHVYDLDELGPKPSVMVGHLPEPWEIGCNSNFDVYARSVRKTEPFKDGLRSGSFHLHIGNPEFESGEGPLTDMASKEIAIKLMDIFVGVPSIIFDNDDTSLARRMLYGKAGEFRPTPYGIEWRVLSNYALRSPRLVELVLDLADHAINHFNEGTEHDVMKSTDFDMVRTAIDTNNKTLAVMAMRKSGLPESMMNRIDNACKWEPNFEAAWNLV